MRKKIKILGLTLALLCVSGSTVFAKTEKMGIIQQLTFCRQTAQKEEKIAEFQNELLARQSIGITSVANARQLGGYVMQDGRVIRPNMLLRTAQLSTLTPEDKALLEAMPVTAVVDFRSGSAYEPGEDVVPDGAKYYRLPIAVSLLNLRITGDPSDRMSMLLQYAQQTGMHEYYPELLSNEDVQKSYRSFFDVLLSDDQGAVLWHCSQGKDRAGLASMLVLSVLGASRETILEDFALSALAYDASAKQVMAMFEQRGVDEETLTRLHGIISVDRQNMEAALDFVDETYGGMDAYLHNQIGLSDVEIAKIREKYLEP